MTQRSRAQWLKQYGLQVSQTQPDIDVDDPVTFERPRGAVDAAERDRLEVLARAAAGASTTEHEYVERFRAGGGTIWACSAAANTVTSYAVQFGSGRPYTDGDLGTDLLLPVLRGHWDTGPHAQVEAAAAWREYRYPSDFDRHRVRLSHPVVWTRMLADAERFGSYLRAIPARDTAVWAHAAARTGGVFAAWSARAPQPWCAHFACAALELGRSAQASAHEPGSAGIDPDLSQVAYGLAQLDSAAPDPAREQLLLLVHLFGAMLLIGAAHRARGEFARRQGLEAAIEAVAMVWRDLHAKAQREGNAR